MIRYCYKESPCHGRRKYSHEEKLPQPIMRSIPANFLQLVALCLLFMSAPMSTYSFFFFSSSRVHLIWRRRHYSNAPSTASNVKLRDWISLDIKARERNLTGEKITRKRHPKFKDVGKVCSELEVAFFDPSCPTSMCSPKLVLIY